MEIIDQGVGMTPAAMRVANETLGSPQDFGLASLTTDSRLGLFVISRLGNQYGISVRLTESDYGGVRAIVLVPTALISSERVADENLTRAGSPLPAAHDARDSTSVRAAPTTPDTVHTTTVSPTSRDEDPGHTAPWVEVVPPRTAAPIRPYHVATGKRTSLPSWPRPMSLRNREFRHHVPPSKREI